MNRRISTLLIAIAAMAPACGGGNSALTRTEAEKAIKAKSQYPRAIVQRCDTQLAAGNAEYLERYQAHFARLQAQGLATFTTGSFQSGSGTLTTFTATLSDKGQSYVVTPLTMDYSASPPRQFCTVKAGQIEFGDITGIVESKQSNTAEVHYTEKVAATPFATALGISTQPTAHTTTFTKYDDGWRLNSGTQ
jgi:hypothetical protein